MPTNTLELDLILLLLIIYAKSVKEMDTTPK